MSYKWLLTHYPGGYGIRFSSQYAFLLYFEKRKIFFEKKDYAAVVFMNLSQAFNSINHELLIAKLHAYGFSKNGLKLLFHYISDCR